jgi:hypothetical protein
MPDQTPPADNGVPVADLAQLWACARAGQQAAAAIATRAGVDDDLRWTDAAGHLGEAADELQRANPNVNRLTDVAALASDVADLPIEEATSLLLQAIVIGLHAFDVDNPALSPADLLAAAAAAHWLGLAHYALTGRLP